MNVQPGQVARFIRSDHGNVGKIVLVLRADPDFRKAYGGNWWVCEALQPVGATHRGRDVEILPGENLSARDSYLEPLPPPPEESREEESRVRERVV